MGMPIGLWPEDAAMAQRSARKTEVSSTDPFPWQHRMDSRSALLYTYHRDLARIALQKCLAPSLDVNGYRTTLKDGLSLDVYYTLQKGKRLSVAARTNDTGELPVFPLDAYVLAEPVFTSGEFDEIWDIELVGFIYRDDLIRHGRWASWPSHDGSISERWTVNRAFMQSMDRLGVPLNWWPTVIVGSKEEEKEAVQSSPETEEEFCDLTEEEKVIADRFVEDIKRIFDAAELEEGSK